MKIIIMCLLVLTARAEFNTEAFLQALAMKETGTGWNGEPGPCGELSKWQITATTWRQEMDVPFAAARNEQIARACALRHLARLRAQITAVGHDATPERLATCWHYGASHKRKPSVWGREVANLYESLTR